MAKGLTSGEISARYAKALYELADSANGLDAVAKDLARLKEVVETSHDVSRALASPLMSRAEFAQLVDELAASVKASPLTLRFLQLLAIRRRLSLLPAAVDAFARRLADAQDEVGVTVTLPAEPTAKELDHITQDLANSLGKKVRVTTRTDARLLGGMVVRIGDRMIDASLRGKLERLRQQLKQAA